MVRSHAHTRLAACEASWGGATAPPHEQILAATPGQGGRTPWDQAVKPVLLRAYDADGSGSLNTTEELLSIPCETWAALDARVREGWGMGIRVIYGFQADKQWGGGELGFDESIRAGADMRAASCEGGATAQAPTPPVATSGSVAEQIRARPEPGGQTAWDGAVKSILLAAYDANRNGSLDTAAEATALTCDDWKALDDGVKASWQNGIRTIYGFEPGYIWVGDALGFSETIRTSADGDLAACVGAVRTPGDQIRALPLTGGTSDWDAAVKLILVASYDTDRSGAIDTASELAAMACDTWSALDGGVRQSYPYGIRPIYGFQEGYSYLGYALGISEAVRTHGDAALVGCGLGG